MLNMIYLILLFYIFIHLIIYVWRRYFIFKIICHYIHSIYLRKEEKEEKKNDNVIFLFS